MANSDLQVKLRVLNLPQNFCFQGDAAQILQQIAASLVGQLPMGASNVVIGNSEPTDPAVTALWLRTNNSGAFVGIYVFDSGSWVQIYPVPGQLTWVYRNPGSSTDVPEGFIRADQDPLIDGDIITFLTATWMPDPDSPGNYLVYQVTPDF